MQELEPGQETWGIATPIHDLLPILDGLLPPRSDKQSREQQSIVNMWGPRAVGRLAALVCALRQARAIACAYYFQEADCKGWSDAGMCVWDAAVGRCSVGEPLPEGFVAIASVSEEQLPPAPEGKLGAPLHSTCGAGPGLCKPCSACPVNTAPQCRAGRRSLGLDVPSTGCFDKPTPGFSCAQQRQWGKASQCSAVQCCC